MLKEIILFLLVLAFLARPVSATTGIGIGPIETNISLRPMEGYSFYIVLFNPGDKDALVDLNVYCTNCLQDYKIFGDYIGKISYTADFIEAPTQVNVEKNTSVMNGEFVELKINVPMSIKEQLILPDNSIIPFYDLTSRLDELDFKIVATTGDNTKISVISNLRLKVF